MALRVVVNVENGAFRAHRVDQVEMPAPDTATAATASARSGTFAEVRDSSERVLYRADVTGAFEPTVEVFAPDGTAQRVNVSSEKRTLMIVVPDLETASAIVFVRRQRSLPGEDRRIASDDTGELGRVSLRRTGGGE